MEYVYDDDDDDDDDDVGNSNFVSILCVDNTYLNILFTFSHLYLHLHFSKSILITGESCVHIFGWVAQPV